jgi:ABC-type transport system substrate-binding protein
VQLAGCTPASEAASPGRVLRYGTDLVQIMGDLPLDPIASRTASQMAHLAPLYDTLVRQTVRGFEPGLATNWEILDQRSLRVRLRPGVRFHDGQELDAQAVKASIERSLASNNANFRPAFFALEWIEVIDRLELVIHLSRDVAGEFLGTLAGRETMPVSPGARMDASGKLLEPAGAGPFRLQSFAPERKLALRRNADHWQAAEIQLDGIDFLQTPLGPQRVNALSTGRVDLTQLLTTREAQVLAGMGGFAVYPFSSDGFFHYLGFYKDRPPLDDVRVRRALGYALDREAIRLALFGEHGEVAYQPWPEDSPYYSRELGQAYAYDPDRARALLTEAGYADGFELRLMSRGAPELIRAAEIVHQNLRDVGIELRLSQTTAIVDEFFRGRRAELTLEAWQRSGLQKITRMFGPHSVANIGPVHLPEIDRLTAELARLRPGDPAGAHLWHSIAEIVVDQALVHFLVFGSDYFAVDTRRVGGFAPDQIMPIMRGVPIFTNLHIRD